MALSNMLYEAWEHYLWNKRQDGIEFEKVGPHLQSLPRWFPRRKQIRIKETRM